ncbi:MAG: site-specific DNA-methyltransferase, partial [Candidatus Methanomethylophilaceae archaeon]|nr:site-specific DNA-methyltransferase [Candidatus Methanomethylophilaceae archaeon]
MKTIESYGKPDAGNIVIEADNLDALKALGEEYTGKIDVITIDPPYNTDISYIGYKDSDYSEGWGKFMGDRLSLAKGLLSPTGVMFINIDENELVCLLNICYSLFGTDNVNVLIWPKVNPLFDQNRVEKPIFNIRSTHEFIVLCYNDKKSTHFGKTVDGKPMESIVAGYGTTSSAKDEICELLGDRKCFSTPKPDALLR